MYQLKTKELKKFLKRRFDHDLEIALYLDNFQYARNVGEIFRIADATKVRKVFMGGTTPTPPFGKDLQKVSRKKEDKIQWEKVTNPAKTFDKLKKEGYLILALEITDESPSITDFDYSGINKVIIILGNEVNGIHKTTLNYADKSIMIPMYGKGASLNVSVSAAILIYFLILNT